MSAGEGTRTSKKYKTKNLANINEVIEYMKGVMKDKEAAPLRRDRMAKLLMQHCTRMAKDMRGTKGTRPIDNPDGSKNFNSKKGKKQVRSEEAKTAAKGTEWERILN